jgi:hypothetical protein
MSEWSTYSLTDFLLFSPRTYYRLFELYNEAVWPAHIAAIALGLAVLALARMGDGRAIAAILAAAWMWAGVAFHLDRYATINWAATYFAGAFVLQAVLLLWTGVVRDALAPDPAASLAGRAGLALVAFALFIAPAIGPLLGRDWRQIELFGLAPDPTAVATLGAVLLSARTQWHLLAVPVLWCVFTGLTLLAMAAPDAFVAPTAAALALAMAAWKTVARSRGETAA